MISISKKQNCSGCFACFNVCPQKCIIMKQDEEGFHYPDVDKIKCINCSACEKVCPILNNKQMDNKPDAYACYNKDEDIRLQSSSGGIFTLVAENVINNNGVVFGACFDDNFHVVHDFTETKEGLSRFRGSKYVQSKIGDAYKKVKDFLYEEREVLFTGTPCQIGGLKSYLKKEYDNLFCIDVICHGVPSPTVWDDYVKYRGNLSNERIQRIVFRRKDEGWRLFSMAFSFKDDTEYRENLNKDLFMQAFLKDACLRPSCYECNFKTLYRQSDITLGDFWGVENIAHHIDDDKGTSLIFVNSAKGQSMFNKIQDNLIYLKVDIIDAVKYNSAAIKSVLLTKRRDKFFKFYNKIAIDKAIKRATKDSLMFRYKKLMYRVYSKIKKKY